MSNSQIKMASWRKVSGIVLPTCPTKQRSRNQKRRPERPPQAEGLPYEKSALAREDSDQL
jgi:hypothetical protein